MPKLTKAGKAAVKAGTYRRRPPHVYKQWDNRDNKIAILRRWESSYALTSWATGVQAMANALGLLPQYVEKIVREHFKNI